MYNDYRLTIGFAPTRRRMYEPENAFVNKRSILKKIKEIAGEGVEIVDIDFLNDEGILIEVGDVAKVEKYFMDKNVNALFMPHCNYGTEEVVAMLGRKMGVPFLLYGPRDLSPPQDGKRIRQTDTQCGLFPSSKALQRYKVPFTYIENCPVESDTFEKGFELFIRAALVANKFKNMRVGQLNARPKPFLCVMHNESELLEKFGIEIVPITAAEIVSSLNKFIENKNDEVKEVINEIQKTRNLDNAKKENLEKHAALRLAMLDAAKAHNLDAIGSECWTVIPQMAGFSPCAAFGDIINCGLPIGCETDVLCAITMSLLLSASRGKGYPFCADLTVRHPEDDNTELLWHCGPFPSGGAIKDKVPEVSGDVGWFEMDHGKMTISRFDSLDGVYSILAGEGEAVPGPATNGTYSWFKVDNWPKWEREIMYGPYIHHVAGIHGHYGGILEEACRYTGFKVDRLPK